MVSHSLIGLDNFSTNVSNQEQFVQLVANNLHHGQKAQAAFLAMVEQDKRELGQEENNFDFHRAVSFDSHDSSGKPLVFLNCFQASQTYPVRPVSYNERLLLGGWVAPRFVWPNIEPFRSKAMLSGGLLKAAVIAPGTARQEADRSRKLRRVLAGIHVARLEWRGIYNPDDGLIATPTELRVLFGAAPSHWLINLDANDDVLLHPSCFQEIAKPENRLFIAARYVQLFVERGWGLSEPADRPAKGHLIGK